MSSENYVGWTAAQHIAEGQRLLSGISETLTTHEGYNVEADRLIAEAQVHITAAQAINGLPAPAAVDLDGLSDEELWDSPVGHRLRNYADKLLAGEQARIEQVSRNRANAAGMMAGVDAARAIVSALGDPMNREDDWATYRSPVLEGLRGAVKATDGTLPVVQEATKAYVAELEA